MTDRGAAERACKDPNPIIDGRKANVNLAYLGAKPRSIQTGETDGRPGGRMSFFQIIVWSPTSSFESGTL